MSWKRAFIAGLFCVIASPVLADPGVIVDLVRTGGPGTTPVLDASGNWQWRVSIDPDDSLYANSGPTGTPPNTVGGSVAIEIGLTFSGAPIVSVTPNTTNFP